MATSDAQKRATKKYSETEKGKEARLKAVQKHQATEHGQEVLKAAQERFEASEKRKAYLREWHRKRRLKLKNEKLAAEKENQ
jgi:tryptophanyl-tRNA synthetase